jgi:radical SAM superfamily enzyme YgiQ (UPF0313 family)
LKAEHNNEIFLFRRLSGGELKVLNCFPNTYAVGMASLGYQTIFKLFASNPKTHTFRYFTDWHEIFPKHFDLMSFSVSWELDFINIINILSELNIPIKACDRDASHPLVYAGGPVLTANPEPWADFFDFIAIGDSENNTDLIIDAALDYKIGTKPRKELLEAFLSIPGIYVPQLSQKTISREKSKTNQLASSSVIAPDSCWGDTALIEVVRSCPEMCKFCLASWLTLPFRAPDLEGDLIPKVKEILKYTKNLGLLGASVTQHPEFIDLLKFIAGQAEKINLQIASVRAGTVTQELCELLVKCGVQNLTIAVESGSERLRNIINKKLPEIDIFNAASAANKAGIKSLKMYGMVGLPYEEEADIDATIDMLLRLKAANKTLKIIWGTSIFTPKAQTPFQVFGVDPNSGAKIDKLAKALKPEGIELRPESYKWAQVQALISRGDRSINDLLIDVHKSKQSGFNIYKKLLNKKTYEHFVFKNWQSDIESNIYKYPWSHLMAK